MTRLVTRSVRIHPYFSNRSARDFVACFRQQSARLGVSLLTKVIATHCYYSRNETRAGRQCFKLLRAPSSYAVLVSAVGTIHCTGINWRERFALDNQINLLATPRLSELILHTIHSLDADVEMKVRELEISISLRYSRAIACSATSRFDVALVS